MVVSPGSTPVARPLVSIVATVGCELVQLGGPTSDVKSWLLPNTLAVNCSVWLCDAQFGVDGLTTTLSTRSCTNTFTGVLLSDPDDAVICAVPVGPGVQTTGMVSESHVPAHARPLLAMVTTAVLLDLNVMVWLASVAPVPSCTAPLNPTVAPRFRDALVGETTTVVGTPA